MHARRSLTGGTVLLRLVISRAGVLLRIPSSELLTTRKERATRERCEWAPGRHMGRNNQNHKKRGRDQGGDTRGFFGAARQTVFRLHAAQHNPHHIAVHHISSSWSCPRLRHRWAQLKKCHILPRRGAYTVYRVRSSTPTANALRTEVYSWTQCASIGLRVDWTGLGGWRE